jgi:hypothetical protein
MAKQNFACQARVSIAIVVRPYLDAHMTRFFFTGYFYFWQFQPKAVE